MYRNDFTADGLTKNFTFDFPVFQAADVEVIVNGVRPEQQPTITLDSALTGGTISFSVAPSQGSVISAIRLTKITRPMDYDPAQCVDVEQLNADLSLLVNVLKDASGVNVSAMQATSLLPTLQAYVEDRVAYIQSLLHTNEDWGSITDPVPNL